VDAIHIKPRHERVVPPGYKRPNSSASALAVPNLATVTPLFASKLSSTFSALLNSHSVVSPLDVFKYRAMAITI
jgi:hypothetical protein